jgi:uncharacterized protein (DUF2252 family)
LTTPASHSESAKGRQPARARAATSAGHRRSLPLEVAHLSVAERVQQGRAARTAVPRGSHAGFVPAAHRPDPVERLESQARSRVPELVPIRYGRMLVSPFAFYRGAALIMAGDLASTPHSGLRAQLCGDAHLSNFGVFASQEQRLIFDLNDFDETLPGPWEWDVKRLAASIAIVGRDNGYSTKQRKRIIETTVAGYRKAMRRFARMRNLDVDNARLEIDELSAALRKAMRTRAERPLATARTRDNLTALSKLTHQVGDERRIISDPPLIEPIAELLPGAEGAQLTDALHELMRNYRRSLQVDRRVLLERYRIVDMARKVVGVGSVGTRDWIILLLGRDGDDPLFLQFKEAQASVLEQFAGKSAYKSHGERVVAGQHLMQASSDIFLGWPHPTTTPGESKRDYYGRQLNDWKASAELDVMRPKGMATYGQMCGWTLARAHARSGDPIAIAAYLGRNTTFDRAIAEFAEAYADQNYRDYQLLLVAAKTGRVQAQTGL